MKDDIEARTAESIAVFLERMGEQKDDGVLLAAADWIRNGDWRPVAAVENNAAAKAAREAIKVTKERRGYTCHACLEMQAHGDDDTRGLRHTKRSGCRFFVVKP